MSLIISVDSVSKYFSSEPALDRVSLEVRTGQHIALIGPNGAGKTTLLKILMGDLDPDRGEISFSKSASLGFLRQQHQVPDELTIWDSAKLAMKAITDLVDQAHQLAEQLACEPDDQKRKAISNQYDLINSELTHRGGYQIEYKIQQVLEGLGFSKSDYDRPASQLSGGQLNRLMLARLLLEEPTLMLLDEPSNHLDIPSTEWLEDFLTHSSQAFLLVSHDRYFLDRVTNQTLEIINGRIDKYPGNYTKYIELKQQRLEIQKKTFEKQQAEIAKTKDFIRRNHYGLKHAQAEDRRKKLERIKLVEVPREIHSPPMRFAQATRSGDIVVRVKDLSKSFGDLGLFEKLNLQIQRGQRWGILGPNGCGKSTFLKCLIGQIPCDSGTIQIGTGVETGYFDQHLTTVDDEKTAAEAIRPRHKEMIDQERRDLLAMFGVTGDMALQKIKNLSGGERNRVSLAFLAAQDANFLVLDEPTNHLDLWARQSLESAIKKFAGTVLMVSHDRYFINQICDHLIVFEGSRVEVFEGNYDTYRLIRQQAKQQEAVALGPANRQKVNEKQNNKPAKPKRTFPYRKVAEIEADIQSHEQKIEQLHFELVNPEVLRDGNLVIGIKNELAQASDDLKQLYLHWEEAIELN